VCSRRLWAASRGSPNILPPLESYGPEERERCVKIIAANKQQHCCAQFAFFFSIA
jgi:hypothetical protein